MTRFRARTLGRFALLAVAASLLIVPAAGHAGTTNTAAGTSCANEASGGRWCTANSSLYPQARGWYGYVGFGGACGGGPKGTVREANDGSRPCGAPEAPHHAWKWTKQGWVAAVIQPGTRGYVHPYSGSWRWLYVDEQWYAITASSLALEWRVS